MAFASLLHSHHHNTHNNVSGPTVSLFLGVAAMSGASGTVRRRKVARCIRVHTEGNWPACQASVMGKGTMQRQENLKRRGKKKGQSEPSRFDARRLRAYGRILLRRAICLYSRLTLSASERGGLSNSHFGKEKLFEHKCHPSFPHGAPEKQLIRRLCGSSVKLKKRERKKKHILFFSSFQFLFLIRVCMMPPVRSISHLIS